ncbi:arylsulfatase [Anatilimnocola floriformis]|uniref:arylsulfatase n=1 Tax=Anatilimnocola floriformis TaxID=2948575 RepID=UPI0020C592B4|nr:arylsulfatase [Anatilimnocola floriformis]
MRVTAIRWSLPLLLLLNLLVICSELRSAEKRPNVVIFLADDAGWGDYSRNGNRQVSTPHIDSIGASGVTLDRFFVCPVCAPTRAEFLTGRYHPRTGVHGVSTGQERMNLDERTIAEAFQRAGYATGAFGKWHNGSQGPYHPLARGFDEYYGYTSGHWGEYFDPPLEHNGQAIRGKGYIVDLCTDQALAFIDKNREKSFFCYVPFTTPHSPWAVPEKDWARFKDKPITQRGGPQEDLDETRCALAMLENQDGNVGRVLAKLDELKLSDNTIVLYFSDNGPSTPRWTGGMKGKKGTTDEGGVRSTCFLRWPARLPKDRTVKEIAGAIDLLPTLLSLVSIERVGDKPLDGRDLSPLLLGTSSEWPERTIFSSWNRNVSARTQQYRLDNKGELFDLANDPGQMTAVTKEHMAVADKLLAEVKAWKKDVGLGAQPMETPKGAKKSVDPRPIPVGYKPLPRTWLPARDGEPNGGVKRSSSAPNSSYFVNWTSKDDSLVWEIDVLTTGKYAVEILYTCPLESAGSTIELTHQQNKLAGKVAPGWDPPLYTNQDTIARPAGESKMKPFRSLSLGTLELQAGRGPLTLRALEIPGKEVMQLLELNLTLISP